jgi:hypothetical protein
MSNETDPVEIGTEAASEFVNSLPTGQRAWAIKEYQIAKVAAKAAAAAEREAIAKYCDLVEGLLFPDQPPLGERIRRGWHLDKESVP